MEQYSVTIAVNPELEVFQIFDKIRDKHGLDGQKTIVVVPQTLLNYTAQGIERLQTAGLVVTSEDNLQQAIHNAPTNAPNQRYLLILVAASISHLSVQVPEHFTDLSIISCGTNSVHIQPESTYCGINLYEWRGREAYRGWNLQMNDGVDYMPPDVNDIAMAPVDLTKRDAVKVVLRLIIQEVRESFRRSPNASLPWSVNGGSSQAVHRFIKIRPDGILIPVTVANGIVAGGAVAARGLTLFFVPFRMIAKWMAFAWPHFIKLLKAVWAFFNDTEKLQSFLQSCFTALSAYRQARTFMG